MKKIMKRIILSAFTMVCVLGMVKSTALAEEAVNRTLLKDGEGVVDYLSNSDEVDYFKFEVKKAGYFKLSFNVDPNYKNSSGYGWDVVISDEKEGDIWSTRKAVASFDSGVMPYSPGTYYVRVHANDTWQYRPPVNEKYTIKVDMYEASDWESEHNNYFEDADVISTNSTYSGYLQYADDTDYYEFTTTSDGYFTVDFGLAKGAIRTSDMGWDVAIYDGDRQCLKYYSDVRKSMNSVPISYGKGTYYVCVMPRDTWGPRPPVGTHYNLTVNEIKTSVWELEDNGTPKTANTITQDTAYSGLLLYAEDADYYKFETTKNGYFYFDFNLPDGNLTGTGTFGFNVDILNKDLDVLKSYSGIKSKFTSIEMPYAPDIYYVRVEANDTWGDRPPIDVCYSLEVKEKKTSNWELEYNDTEQTAKSIKLNTDYSGYLAKDSDIDFYKFTTDHVGSFSVSLGILENMAFPSSYNGWDVIVYDSQFNEVATCKNAKNNQVSNAVVYYPGTYYIKVKANFNIYAPIEVKYELRVDEPAEKDAYAVYDGCYFYRNSAGDTVCYRVLDGTQVFNEFKCDGTYTYFFQADGTAMKNRLTYHPDGEHVIYFDEYGHEVFSDFANVKKTIAGEDVDDYCFFDVNGYLYVDVVTYDKEGKNLYYANPYGVMERGKWFEFSDSVKWADGTPFDKAGGKYGYANADSTLLINTWTYDWEGRECYMQGNGVALYSSN